MTDQSTSLEFPEYHYSKYVRACQSCDYWHQIEDANHGGWRGVCRYGPPRDDDNWPTVLPDDWCRCYHPWWERIVIREDKPKLNEETRPCPVNSAAKP